MNKPLWSQDIWRHLGSPARAWVHAYCLPDPSSQGTDTPCNQEADALAQVCDLATDPSVDTTDWVHRKSHYHSIQVERYIAKDAGLPLKCSDLVNAVTACPVCSKQCPRQHYGWLDPSTTVLNWGGTGKLIILAPSLQVRAQSMSWLVWTLCVV